MGTRRLGFALLAALVISLGISSVFYVRITRTQASTRPNTKRVVAAAVALQPGAPITAENLTEINWPVNVNVVTLLVSPEQSEKLALAQNQGTIHFVLRNGGDSANTDVPAVDMAELT